MSARKSSAAIFWDLGGFPFPSDANGYEILGGLRKSLSKFGSITSIRGYFATKQAIHKELQAGGVDLVELHELEVKNSASSAFTVDVMTHAFDNPDSTVILVFLDKNYDRLVSILSLRQHNVVVVTIPGGSFNKAAMACASESISVCDIIHLSQQHSFTEQREDLIEPPEDHTDGGISLHTDGDRIIDEYRPLQSTHSVADSVSVGELRDAAEFFNQIPEAVYAKSPSVSPHPSPQIPQTHVLSNLNSPAASLRTVSSQPRSRPFSRISYPKPMETPPLPNQLVAQKLSNQTAPPSEVSVQTYSSARFSILPEPPSTGQVPYYYARPESVCKSIEDRPTPPMFSPPISAVGRPYSPMSPSDAASPTPSEPELLTRDEHEPNIPYFAELSIPSGRWKTQSPKISLSPLLIEHISPVSHVEQVPTMENVREEMTYTVLGGLREESPLTVSSPDCRTVPSHEDLVQVSSCFEPLVKVLKAFRTIGENRPRLSLIATVTMDLYPEVLGEALVTEWTDYTSKAEEQRLIVSSPFGERISLSPFLWSEATN